MTGGEEGTCGRAGGGLGGDPAPPRPVPPLRCFSREILRTPHPSACGQREHPGALEHSGGFGGSREFWSIPGVLKHPREGKASAHPEAFGASQRSWSILGSQIMSGAQSIPAP